MLFEFQEGNEIDGIGVIHPHKVSTGQDVKDLIPSSATTADEIGKYIQVGDELDCTVKKMDNLEKVKFEEDGEVVEIQPEYSAEQAFKVGGRENKKVDSKFEVIDEIGEIEELEGQLDNMFDEDDVEVIMEVKKTKERGSRSPGRESRRKRSRSRGRRSRSRGRRTRSRGRRSRSKSRKTARSRSKEKKSDSVSGAGVKKDIKLNLTSTLAKVPSKPKVPELEHHPAKVSYRKKNSRC